ncbi:MAG: peptidase, partial [Nitrosopumilus sp.]|nr:peptidase [Nitrosopumilus sp.]
MKTTITAISTIVLLLVVTSTISSAYAEVPGWVKNNAG